MLKKAVTKAPTNASAPKSQDGLNMIASQASMRSSRPPVDDLVASVLEEVGIPGSLRCRNTIYGVRQASELQVQGIINARSLAPPV